MAKKMLKFTLDDGTGTDRTILSGIHAYYEPEELVGKTLIAITNLPPRKMMGVASEGMLMSAIHEEPGDDGEPEERLNLLLVHDRTPPGAKVYSAVARTTPGRPPSPLRRRGPSFVSSFLTAGE